MKALVSALCVIGLITLFSVQNAAPTTISFLFWRFSASLAIVIFLTTLCGFLLGVIATYVARKKTVTKRERGVSGRPSERKNLE